MSGRGEKTSALIKWGEKVARAERYQWSGLISNRGLYAFYLPSPHDARSKTPDPPCILPMGTHTGNKKRTNKVTIFATVLN